MAQVLDCHVASESSAGAVLKRRASGARDIYIRKGYSGCWDVAWALRTKDDLVRYLNPRWAYDAAIPWWDQAASLGTTTLEGLSAGESFRNGTRKWYSAIHVHISMYGVVGIAIGGRAALLQPADLDLLEQCFALAREVRERGWFADYRDE